MSGWWASLRGSCTTTRYHPSSLHTPCRSSPTPREILCPLKCLDIHDAGLTATFVVPSLANGTIRDRCCLRAPIRPSTERSRPRGAQVKLHKGPAGLPSSRLTWGRSIQYTDGMRAVSLSLLLGASIAFRRTSPRLDTAARLR